MKNYLLTILENCSDQSFGQDAVEHGILTGRIILSYELEFDLRTVMGPPGYPEAGQYDALCAEYRQHQHHELDVALADRMGVPLFPTPNFVEL